MTDREYRLLIRELQERIRLLEQQQLDRRTTPWHPQHPPVLIKVVKQINAAANKYVIQIVAGQASTRMQADKFQMPEGLTEPGDPETDTGVGLYLPGNGAASSKLQVVEGTPQYFVGLYVGRTKPTTSNAADGGRPIVVFGGGAGESPRYVECTNDGGHLNPVWVKDVSGGLGSGPVTGSEYNVFVVRHTSTGDRFWQVGGVQLGLPSRTTQFLVLQTMDATGEPQAIDFDYVKGAP